MLVTAEDEVDVGPLQALDRVAGVVDDVALAARPGPAAVVVHDEHAHAGVGANSSSIHG